MFEKVKNRVVFFGNVANEGQPRRVDFPQLEGQKNGIRRHHKVTALVLRILSMLSCGAFNKVVTVRLDDRTIYVNKNSYLKWRQIQGGALLAFGVQLRANGAGTNAEIANEIRAIHSNFERRNYRPDYRFITDAEDPFSMYEAATKQAEWKIRESTGKGPLVEGDVGYGVYREIRLQLATFYAFTFAKKEAGCIPFVSFSPKARAADGTAELDENEEFKPDLCSSEENKVNPFLIKDQIDILINRNFNDWKAHETAIMGPLFDELPLCETEIEVELLTQLKLISEHQRVFDVPGHQTLLKNAYDETYGELVVNQWLTDENSVNFLPATVLAAYHLLKNGALDQDLLLLNNGVALQSTFEESELTLLSGNLRDEKLVKRSAGQAWEFVGAKSAMNPMESEMFEIELRAWVQAALSDEAQAPAFEESPIFQNLLKVAEVMVVRFSDSYCQQCLANIEYGEDGLGMAKAEVKEEDKTGFDFGTLIERSAGEQQAICDRYFPRRNIQRPVRQEIPRYDDAVTYNRAYNKIAPLFDERQNQAAVGNCGVASLAQALFGNTNARLEQEIRSAVANYFRDFPDQYVPLRGETAQQRAQEIETTLEWFSENEIKAVSSIVGRPIYVYKEDYSGGIKLNVETGELDAQTFNDNFDADPIFLHLHGVHFHLLTRV
ncbi:MAG: OTU domain-containing protein [Parachlamydiaceae bacterium]